MYTTIRFVLQECGDFTWRVSDCEELVGATHRRSWGWLWRNLHVEYKITRKPKLFFLYRFLFSDIP